MANTEFVRPLHLDGPPESATGRGNRRQAGRVARLVLAAALIGGTALAVGCGDGPDAPATPTASGQTNITDGVFTAADLIPDLRSDGFIRQDSGRPPAATADQDVHFAIFAGDPPIIAVRLETNVQKTVEEASAQFGTLADALRNPPPDLFGPNATQTNFTPAYQGDQSRSYVTTRPDGQGNLVYTDIHRFGRAIVIVYVISSDPDEAAELREQLARWIESKVEN